MTLVAGVAQKEGRPKPAVAPVRGPIRIPLRRRLVVYGVAAGVWGSGATWLVLHYFLQGKGEFGPTTNPAEPWLLRLHGAFAFAALWTFGLLWGVHVVNGWAARKRRWSGSILFLAIASMISTAWLLYYVGDEAVRSVIAVLHWTIGIAAAPALFAAHRYFHKFSRD